MLLQRRFATNAFQLLALILMLVLAAVSAQGQDEEPTDYLTISNPYVAVTLYSTGNGGYAGHFDIRNVLGDTSIDSDDHKSMVEWCRTLIMVDGKPEEEGAPMQWLPFEGSGFLGLWGSVPPDGHGIWIARPYIVTGEQCLRAVWRPTSDDAVTPIDVEQEIRVMHNMVRLKWTITNNDLVNHQVGLKFCGDVVADPENSGTVDLDNAVSVPGRSLIDECSLFTASNVPPQFEVFDSASETRQGVRLVLDGQKATRPDVLGIDEYANVTFPLWSYLPDYSKPSVTPKFEWLYEIFPEHSPIVYNVGYAAFWKPVIVGPGRSRTIIHYISNPGADSIVNLPSVDMPKYSGTVEGPRALKYYMDEVSGEEVLGPTPFKITAFLENTDRFMNLPDCSFTLILPPGLALDASELNEQGKPQFNKRLAQIPAGTDGSVSWKVKADGTRTGILTYYVAISSFLNGQPVVGMTVERSIHVPAVSTQRVAFGWQQLSVPFDLVDTDPIAALGLPFGTIKKTRLGDDAILRYDPTLPANAPYYPYEAVQSLTPGEGYWVMTTQSATTAMPTGNYMAKQWEGLVGHPIPVHTGWNMIGNPFVYAVTMGELRFDTQSYGNITYDEAVARRLVSRTLYWWNTTFSTWNWSTQRTAQLRPWQGHWIKILDPNVRAVMITPASQIGAQVGGTPPPGGGGGQDPPPPGGP